MYRAPDQDHNSENESKLVELIKFLTGYIQKSLLEGISGEEHKYLTGELVLQNVHLAFPVPAIKCASCL